MPLSDTMLKLLKLIEEEKTNNEICFNLNISNRQLYSYLTTLQTKGFYFQRKYYSNGTIIYKPIKNINNLQSILSMNNNSNKIITSPTENKLKTLTISDIHIGNELQRLDLLSRAYKYCQDNDIHIIFCCGDIIDGATTRGTQIISDTYEQIEFLKNNFPSDKHILVFGTAGNHDETSLQHNQQDLLTILRNYRHDIIMNTYNNAIIEIKNDNIQLIHKFNKNINKEGSIIYYGHTHQYQTSLGIDHVISVYVPSLSNIIQPMPSAIETSYDFKSGYIDNVDFKQIYFGEEDYILSTVKYSNLTMKRNYQSIGIKNIEDIKPEILYDVDEKNKTLTKTLSQVEKFNKKYNL